MNKLEARNFSTESALSYVSCRSPSSINRCILTPTKPYPVIMRQRKVSSDTINATPEFSFNVSRAESSPTTTIDDNVISKRIKTISDNVDSPNLPVAMRSPYPLMNSTCIIRSDSECSRRPFNCTADISIISSARSIASHHGPSIPECMIYDDEDDFLDSEYEHRPKYPTPYIPEAKPRRARLNACKSTFDHAFVNISKLEDNVVHDIPSVIITSNSKSQNGDSETKIQSYKQYRKTLTPVVTCRYSNSSPDVVPENIIPNILVDEEDEIQNKLKITSKMIAMSTASPIFRNENGCSDRYNITSKAEFKQLKIINKQDSEGPKAPPPTPNPRTTVNQLDKTPTCKIIFSNGTGYKDTSLNATAITQNCSNVCASDVVRRLEAKLSEENKSQKRLTNINIEQKFTNYKRELLTFIGPLDTTFSRRILRYTDSMNRHEKKALPRPDPIVILRATMGPVVAAEMQSEQNNQIRGTPRHLGIAIVMITYLLLGMVAVLPGQSIHDFNFNIPFDMNKTILTVAGRETGTVFGALMVGGAFRGHRWFLGYSTAACIAAISLACSNLVTNFKALSALFVAIGVTTAFNETASNVITLRMANRRRITLNYHQLAYAMGSVAMCFLSSHFLDTENSFDTRQAVGGAMGIRALYYYTAIAFVFVACLALAYWYFIERIEIKDLCESHFLVKQEYNRLTKLDTLISLFYFAQVGHMRIYEWLLFTFCFYSKIVTGGNIILFCATYHVARGVYFIYEIIGTALQVKRTAFLLPFSLIGCIISSIGMLICVQTDPLIMWICIGVQGFSSAAIGPTTMVYFNRFHNTIISGTRSRFWGGSFGSVFFPCIATFFMRGDSDYHLQAFQVLSIVCVGIQIGVCIILYFAGTHISTYARKQSHRNSNGDDKYWKFLSCFL